MARLAREVERTGASVRFGATVDRWRVEGDTIRAVEVGGEPFGADEFVLAAGMWSKDIARRLGFRLPMQSGKGYSLTIPAASAAAQPRTCAILSEARLAMTPMGEDIRFGGTMEVTGIDETIDHDRVRGIAEAVSRYYPDFSPSRFASARVRVGLRPCSPDGLPYIGRVSRYVNLCVATGHAMMGVSLAPITGKLIAEIIAGEPASCRIDALNPDRYA
jgi:D-amino-acid dehydrogenase